MRRLDEVTSLLKDGTHFSPHSTEGPFKYLTSRNVRFGRLDLTKVQQISEEEHKSIYATCPVEFGDVLLTKDGANAGNVAINNLHEKFSLLSSVAVLRGTNGILHNPYLLQYLMSPIGQAAIAGEIAGQAITRITVTVLRQLRIPIPPFEIQERMASILGEWDENRRVLEDLIGAKSRLKQGLLQQLLTGLRRFRGFEDREIIPTRLHEVLEKVATAVDVDPTRMYQEIGIRSHGKGLFHKEPVMGHVLAEKRVYRVVPDCLTLNIVFAWERALAVTTSREEGMVVSHRFPMFRPNRDRILPEYAFMYMLSQPGEEALQLASPGGAGRNRTLSQTEFLKTVIPLPCLDEQRRIVEFINVIDLEIETLQKLLAALKEQKKGLMQKLLTGEVRIKGES